MKPGRGFTLIEVLVVITIVAILIALALSSLRSVRAGVDDTRCLSNLRELMRGVNYLRNADNGLLPFASVAPAQPDGPALHWQKLHAEWSEAMGVSPPRVVEGAHDKNGWKVYETQAPWRCPLDKPGVILRSDFPGDSDIPDENYSYAAVTLTSYEYWAASHMTVIISRGWDAIVARRVVGQAYEDAPNAPVLDEAYKFHNIGKPTRYGNAGFVDGSAGKPRMSKEQQADFWNGIIKKYPKPKS